MSQSRNDSAKVAGATYTAGRPGILREADAQAVRGVWGLWGLAVAAVISGDFSGWNFGIDFAGFGGMLIAFVILVVMYYGMIFSIGEMAAAMPHTGGAYSFARSAMGPWGGFVTGARRDDRVRRDDGGHRLLLGLLRRRDHQRAARTSRCRTWVWWIILYVVFIALNSAGAAISFKFAIVVSIISIGIILVFSAMAIFSGAFDVGRAVGHRARPGPDRVPAARRAADPVRAAVRDVVLPRHRGAAARRRGVDTTRCATSRKAGFWARGTLIVTGLLVLFLNTGVIGAEATGVAAEPLLDGFRAIVGDQLAAVLALFALIGLLASLQGIMFAYGRNMYSLSRAGYYPKFLSLTGKRQTPWVALRRRRGDRLHRARRARHASPALNEGAGAVAGAIVLNIAVWGAVLAYLLQMVSFVILRRKFPNAKRPYVQPVGHPRRGHRGRDRGAHLRRASCSTRRSCRRSSRSSSSTS